MQNNVINDQSIKAWLVEKLANLLKISESEIDLDVPFDRYGLDSSAAVELTGDLADWLKADLEPTLLYDYSTINGLSEYLLKDIV